MSSSPHILAVVSVEAIVPLQVVTVSAMSRRGYIARTTPIELNGQPICSNSTERAITGAHVVPGAMMMIIAPSVASCSHDRFIPYMFAAVRVITASERQKAFLFSEAPTGTAKEYSLDEIPIDLHALRLSGIAAFAEHVEKAVTIVLADFLNM